MPQHIYQWHPIFVHFTIAPLAISAVLFAFVWRIGNPAWRTRLLAAAELNLWIGTAVTALTVVFGWIAFGTVPHDETVHELMVRHRTFALATFGGFVALTAVSIWHRRHAGYPSFLFAVALLGGLAGLAATAVLGGQLVFEHGLAVERPAAMAPSGERPATESQPDHHHDHSHK
jgi:uncharacterized membrane protein